MARHDEKRKQNIATIEKTVCFMTGIKERLSRFWGCLEQEVNRAYMPLQHSMPFPVKLQLKHGEGFN